MTKLFKASALYSVGNFIPQIVNFILLPLYSSILTREEYGAIAKFEMYIYIFNILMSFCLDRSAQRLYFDANTIDDKKNVLSTFFVSIFFISLSVFLFGMMFNVLINSTLINVIFFSLLVSMMNSLSLISINFYQLTERPLVYVSLKLFRFAVNVVLIVYVLLYIESTAEGKMTADALTLIIMFPVYLFVAFKKFGFKFDSEILFKGIKYSYPLIPTLFVAWIITLSNRVFIEEYIGLEAVGFFSMGFKVSSIVLVLCSAISSAYLPIFYKTANKYDCTHVEKFSNIFIMYILLLACFCILLFVPELVEFVLDEKYKGLELIIFLLIVTNMINGMLGISTVLYILQSKKTKYNFYSGALVAIISVITNNVLIPHYEVIGAAFSSLISAVCLIFLQNYFAKKGFYINYNYKKLIVISVFFMLISLCIQFVDVSINYLFYKVVFIMLLLLLCWKFKKRFNI